MQQAHHLATYQGVNATQADFRRAVSTAYYALFHLLVEDCAQRWQGSSHAGAAGINRAMDHGPMKSTSAQFKSARWQDWRGVTQSVPPALQRVAHAFIDLQEERHLADYDNYEQWSVTDVHAVLDIARIAFQDWASIRTDPMAGNYLLSMLLGKRRQ
ncbi:MAG TPA: hypothetical protein VGV35_11220 [Bryobacteraceae bacterium]|nr:hypothetical protein [Bryobacteraceae bacterium]